jgi:hypothetical protein
MLNATGSQPVKPVVSRHSVHEGCKILPHLGHVASCRTFLLTGLLPVHRIFRDDFFEDVGIDRSDCPILTLSPCPITGSNK